MEDFTKIFIKNVGEFIKYFLDIYVAYNNPIN